MMAWYTLRLLNSLSLSAMRTNVTKNNDKLIRLAFLGWLTRVHKLLEMVTGTLRYSFGMFSI
jgi:hypothetical protein